MIREIQRMAADGLIGQNELEQGRTAQQAGSRRHTIGYEAEVLSSAYQETDAYHNDDSLGRSLQYRCDSALSSYGYGVGIDGKYELQSPHSRHPVALAVATQGVVRAGWLPQEAKGVVTSHISFGTQNELPRWSDVPLARILRVVELLGGSTAGRMMAPAIWSEAKGYRTADYGWNCRGTAGVAINYSPNASADSWASNAKRVEFRSLRYLDPVQFGATLDMIYHLSRGYVAGPYTPANNTYLQFDKWVYKYFKKQGLPDLEDMTIGEIEDLDTRQNFVNYMKPYVLFAANDDLAPLRARTRNTVDKLRKQFGLGNVVNLMQESWLEQPPSKAPLSEVA